MRFFIAFASSFFLLACQTTRWNFVPSAEQTGALAHSLCAAVDGSFIVFGGVDEDAGSPLNSHLSLFDPAAQRWHNLDDNFIIPPRNLASLAVHDQTIYVFGGETEQKPASTDLYAYDLRLKKWQALPKGETLSARKQASLTPVGNELILFGGKGPNAVINWGAYQIGPQHWSIHRLDKDARVSHIALAVSDSELLIWGGFIGNERVNSGFIINTRSQTIVDLPKAEMLSPRANARALKINDQVYIWGGATADGNANSGAVYDLTRRTWQSLPPIPVERYRQLKGAEIAAWGDYGFILIGGRFGAEDFNDQIWQYNTAQRQWSPLSLEHKPDGRIAHCVATLDKATVAVFGGIGYREKTRILTQFDGIWILRRGN